MKKFSSQSRQILLPARKTNSRGVRGFNFGAAALSCVLLALGLFGGIRVAQGQQPDPLTITKDGNVGVGTTIPTYKLDVQGGFFHAAHNTQSYPASTGLGGLAIGWNRTNGRSEVNFYNVYNGAQTAFQFSQKTSASGATDLLTISGNGNVGILTATPVSKLHIHGDYSNNGAGGFALDASDTSDPELYILRINPFVVDPSKVGYQFQTKSAVGGTQIPMTFDNEGRVGIGTIKPRSGLSISSVKARANTPNQVIGELSFVGFDRPQASASILAQSPGWDDASHLIFKTSTGGTGAQEKMRITSDGNVGIGTPNPTRAKVEIIGSISATFSGGYLKSVNVATDVWNPTVRNGIVQVPVGLMNNSNGPISLYADNIIAAASFWAFSDERIKHIEGRSVAARDLATLRGIEVTDYSYIDSLSNGTGTQKKVVGQQVEKVFPQAVSKATDIVPDIYQKATIKDGWIMLATTLKKGDRVRLIGEKQEGIHEVLEVGEGRFRTAFAADGGQVFVYGREVNDARRVDYAAISMLNVSATQELARRLEKLEERAAQTARLEQKNAKVKALQEENAALRSELAAQEKRLAAIEALLLSADKPAARTASLKKVN